MGYPKDLDEYTEAELHEELARRNALRLKGMCDYCGRRSTAQPCKFGGRHKDARITPPPKPAGPVLYAVVDTDNHGGDYPDEKFMQGTEKGVPREEADGIAKRYNERSGEHASRYWKVVELPYKLAPGFEP